MTGARLCALRWIRANLVSSPACILDVGAGNAPFANLLTNRGYVVTAVDRSVDRLDMAPGRYERRVWDLTRIPWPWPPETFDAAIGIYALQHLMLAEERCWREIARVVRPGGQLLVVQRHATHNGQDFSRQDPLNAYCVQGLHDLAMATGWAVHSYDLCVYDATSYQPCGPDHANVIRADLRRAA